jgi:acetolactate decarboxylase
MSPRLEAEVSQSVIRALRERSSSTGEPLARVLDDLLSEALELERHSLFQVSTSSALVQGVFDGTITVSQLKGHGDFGLGTFSGLDGEMILIDSTCLRATAGGAVSEAPDELQVPFALVTWFQDDEITSLDEATTLDDLQAHLDSTRPTENLFMAIRAEGAFSDLSMRAACRALPGEGLVDATAHQSEFEVSDIEGTLVGFWSPEYSRAVSVPGYHFHFISDDRAVGGHVLGLRARRLTVRRHVESDLHLALPETETFLTADLRGDHRAELERAETERRTV